jgi:hypothetical protein
MHHVDLLQVLQQLVGKMVGRSRPARAVVQAARLRARQRHELLERLRRHRGMDDHHILDGGEPCNRREILRRVVGELRIQRRADRDSRRRDDDGIAVRRGLRRHAQRQVAAGARTIVRNEVLPHLLGEFLPDNAAHDVAGRAGGERQDHSDRFGGVRLGYGARGGGNRKQCSRGNDCGDTSRLDHRFISSGTTACYVSNSCRAVAARVNASRRFSSAPRALRP